jgi:HEAT repeats/Galactose oxidase, central domain
MKTNRLSGLLLFLIFIATVFRLSARAAEPSYNGKPLSEWLLILKIGSTSTGERVEDDTEARDAVRQMGTNTIPTLLDILGANDRSKLWVLSKLKSKGFREMYHNPNVPTDDLHDTGVMAFGLLGTNAIPAIPKIKKLLDDWETCSGAAQVLVGLGPAGWDTLTNGLYNSDDNVRGVTLWAIGSKSTMDSNAIARIMIAALKDPDMVNRTTAIRYLGGKDPAVAIPVLLPLLDNPKDYDYAVVGRSLSSYGAAAKAAVPKLLSLYTNHWNIELMWALKAIDMEAAAQAEQLMVNSGPLNNARKGYTRTKLANGLELIAGGYIHTEIPTVNNRELSRAELLDPKTGKWTETSEMNTARDGHTATLLPNGKVLVEGGYGSGVIGKKPPVLSSKELYDPVTGTWTAITNK